VRQIVEQVNPGYYNSATAQRWGEKPPVAAAAIAPAFAAVPGSTVGGDLAVGKAKAKLSEPAIAAPAAILAQSSLSAAPAQMPASSAENAGEKR
jgi:hypothetical protein